jgi:hypothetical protein
MRKLRSMEVLGFLEALIVCYGLSLGILRVHSEGYTLMHCLSSGTIPASATQNPEARAVKVI